MLLSTLLDQLSGASSETLDSAIYLAAPDEVAGDDVDVRLAAIARANVDREKNEITLIPASTAEANDTGTPLIMLKFLLQELPFDTVLWGDFQILAELPLVVEPGESVLKSRVSVDELYLGRESGEAWFLTRPLSEYPSDALPQ